MQLASCVVVIIEMIIVADRCTVELCENQVHDHFSL